MARDWLSVHLLLALAIFLTVIPASAQPAPSASASGQSLLHIRVRGGAEIHATATTTSDGISLHGDLVDDAGAPIPLAQLKLTALSGDASQTVMRLPGIRPCAGAAHRITRGTSGEEATIETDERGVFCAIIDEHSPDAKFSLKLRFAGNKLHDVSEIVVPLEPDHGNQIPVVLQLEPLPEPVDLDRDAINVTASLRIERSEMSRRATGGAIRREGLTLTLEDERGTRIAEATTGGDGRAHFDVKTEKLDGPGAGELVLRFGGNDELAKASDTQPVIRHAEVKLSLTHPVERADAESGIAIELDVSTSRGPVTGGVVEVLREVQGARESLGAGKVEAGHARVIATFAAGGMTRVPISLRYVPAAPWYRAGAELRTTLEIAGPGLLKQALVALVVLATAAWIVGGWRRSPKAASAPSEEIQAAPPSGRAGVRVIASASNAAGWRGVVSDAHEGTPIVGARLKIIAPAFEGDGVVAETTTDEHGSFTLHAAHRSDARLSVSSPEYSDYEQALPPPSVLGVALVTRRRALLERLVRWARRKGAPFDGSPEPTPGHVRRAANRAQAPQIEAWARYVESAVYGPEPVNPATEREARTIEPRAAQ